jgi:hypothetical protein
MLFRAGFLESASVFGHKLSSTGDGIDSASGRVAKE